MLSINRLLINDDGTNDVNSYKYQLSASMMWNYGTNRPVIAGDYVYQAIDAPYIGYSGIFRLPLDISSAEKFVSITSPRQVNGFLDPYTQTIDEQSPLYGGTQIPGSGVLQNGKLYFVTQWWDATYEPSNNAIVNSKFGELHIVDISNQSVTSSTIAMPNAANDKYIVGSENYFVYDVSGDIKITVVGWNKPYDGLNASQSELVQFTFDTSYPEIQSILIESLNSTNITREKFPAVTNIQPLSVYQTGRGVLIDNTIITTNNYSLAGIDIDSPNDIIIKDPFVYQISKAGPLPYVANPSKILEKGYYKISPVPVNDDGVTGVINIQVYNNGVINYNSVFYSYNYVTQKYNSQDKTRILSFNDKSFGFSVTGTDINDNTTQWWGNTGWEAGKYKIVDQQPATGFGMMFNTTITGLGISWGDEITAKNDRILYQNTQLKTIQFGIQFMLYELMT